MFSSVPTDHNETNPKMEKAENPCPTRIFGKRKSSIVSDTLVSKLSNLFGPSGATRTRGFHIPNVAPYQLGYTRIFGCHDYSTKLVRFKVFSCLWSFMWSKPLLCRFQQPGEIPQTQTSQGFAAFRLAPSRIAPRHSQTNCDTLRSTFVI